MNPSSLKAISESVLSPLSSGSISVKEGECNGQQYEQLSVNSELGKKADNSNRVAQTKLEKLDTAYQESMGESGLQLHKITPEGHGINPTEQEDEDDLFSDVVSVSSDQLDVDYSIEKIEKKEKSTEIEEKSSDVENKSKRMEKTDALRSRKVTTDKTDRIKSVFAADLAFEFESRKPKAITYILSASSEYAKFVKPLLQEREIYLSDADVEQMALRAVALRANAKGDINFSEEDIGKASDKTISLLRPDMKDSHGKPIADELFNVIKEEIKQSVCKHFIALDLISQNKGKSEIKNEDKSSAIVNPLSNKIDPKEEKNTVFSQRIFTKIEKKWEGIQEFIEIMSMARWKNEIKEEREKEYDIKKHDIIQFEIKNEDKKKVAVKTNQLFSLALSKLLKEGSVLSYLKNLSIQKTEKGKLNKNKISVATEPDSSPMKIDVIDLRNGTLPGTA